MYENSCRLKSPKCTGSPLVEAHLIGRKFHGIRNFSVSYKRPYAEKRPTGLYDKTMLCAGCDGFLNTQFDEYALTILVDGKGITRGQYIDRNKQLPSIPFYSLEDKEGYSRLVRWVISVLWRLSVASYKDVSKFSLGHYEDKARQAILDPEWIVDSRFSVNLCKIINYPESICILPQRLRNKGVNFYCLWIGSYKLYVRCDQRKVGAFQHTEVSKENDFLMLEVDGTETVEHPNLVKLLQSRNLR